MTEEKRKGRPFGHRTPCIANRCPIGARSHVVAEMFRHMDANRISMTDTAVRVGISNQHMGKMRNGGVTPSIFMVECLANALGFDLVLKPRE